MIDHKIQIKDTNRPLNHQLEVWREVENGTDRYGEKIFKDEMVAKTWGLVIPDRGKEYQDKLQIYQAQSYKVTIRHRNDIDPTYWLVFRGKRLDIEAIQDLQSRMMYMEIICTERVMTDGGGNLDRGTGGIY